MQTLVSADFPYKVFHFRATKQCIIIVAENEQDAIRECQKTVDVLNRINKSEHIDQVFPDCLTEIDITRISTKIL